MHDSLTKESKNLFTGNVHFKTTPLTKVIIIIAAMVNCCKIIKLIKATNSCSFIHSHHGEYVDNVILSQTSIHGTQTSRYLPNFREWLYLFQTSIWLLFEEPDSLGYIIFYGNLNQHHAEWKNRNRTITY